MGTPSDPRQALPPAWRGGCWARPGQCTGEMVECPPGSEASKTKETHTVPGRAAGPGRPSYPAVADAPLPETTLAAQAEGSGIERGDPLPVRTWGGPSQDVSGPHVLKLRHVKTLFWEKQRDMCFGGQGPRTVWDIPRVLHGQHGPHLEDNPAQHQRDLQSQTRQPP